MQRGKRHPKKESSEYYISSYRLYELIYFCLQYPEYKKIVKDYNFNKLESEWEDPTGEEAVRHVLAARKMKLIEDTAYKTSREYGKFIFMAVTEDRSFNNLRTYYGMDLSRDKYYKLRDKFFYLLSQEKHSL